MRERERNEWDRAGQSNYFQYDKRVLVIYLEHAEIQLHIYIIVT